MHTHFEAGTTHKFGHIEKPADDCETCQFLNARRAAKIFAAARVVRDSDHLGFMTPGSKAGGAAFDRAEIAVAYVEEAGAEYATGEDFDDRYQGTWDTFGDFVEDLIDSTGMLENMPENLRPYFDYEAFARDLLLGGDYTSSDLSDFRVLVLSRG